MARPQPSPASKQAVSVLEDLKGGVTELVENYRADRIPLTENAGVARVCFHVERILHMGLKDIAIFGTTTVWDYLAEVKDSLPGGVKLVDRIKNLQKTDIGRARAFIRIGLNEQSLGSFLEALVWNRELTNKYYSRDSLLSSEEYASMLFLLLENIKEVQFTIRIDDPLLGHLYYWDLMARSTENSPGQPKKAPVAPAPSSVGPAHIKSAAHKPENASTPTGTPTNGRPAAQVGNPTSPASSSPPQPVAPVNPPLASAPTATTAPVSSNPFDDYVDPVPTASTTQQNMTSSQPEPQSSTLRRNSDSSKTPEVAPIRESPTKSENKDIEAHHQQNSDQLQNISVSPPNGVSPSHNLSPSPVKTEASQPQLPLVGRLLPDSPSEQTHIHAASFSGATASASPTSPSTGHSIPPSKLPVLSESPVVRESQNSHDFVPVVGESPLPHITLNQQHMNHHEPIQQSTWSDMPTDHTQNNSAEPADPVEKSLLRAPYAAEFDEDTQLPASTPPNYGRVLFTPPNSGKLPGRDASELGEPAGDILGTTPSQDDLPHPLDSLQHRPDVTTHHKQLIVSLQRSITNLNRTSELLTLNSTAARDVVDNIEAILLEGFSSVSSWNAKYASLWSWLASVNPATPHYSQIMPPLTSHAAQHPSPSHVSLCRAFIGSSINKACLDSMLVALGKDAKSHVAVRPEPRSLINNETLFAVFLKLIQELKQFHFDLIEKLVEAAAPITDFSAPTPATPQATPQAIPQPDTSPETSDTALSEVKHEVPAKVSSFAAAIDPNPFAETNGDSNTKEAAPTSAKPPSYKKKKKMVTIQEAPPTPQEKRPPTQATNAEALPRLTFNASSPPNSSPLDAEPLSPAGKTEIPTVTIEKEAPASGAQEPVHKPLHQEVAQPESPSAPGVDPKSASTTESSSSSASSGTIQSGTLTFRPVFERTKDAPEGEAALPSPKKLDVSGPDTPGSQGRRKSARVRSYSFNAPGWAQELAKFRDMEVGSYKPNTDWLGVEEEAENPTIQDWDDPGALSTSPRMTSTMTTAASSSNTPGATRTNYPSRILGTDVLLEYRPSKKQSVIKRPAVRAGELADDNDGTVVKVKQMEGEEAVEDNTQLYRNSRPVDVFVLELIARPMLTAKNAFCSGCGDELTESNARWCSYTGNFYCPLCHTGKIFILPSRVIKQWNFKPGKVSDWAYTYLQENWPRPVLDVTNLVIAKEESSSLIPGLPSLPLPSIKSIKSVGKKMVGLMGASTEASHPVSVIAQLTILRERLVIVAEFIRSCRNGQRLLGNLASRLHLLWSSTLWSMQDLVDARTGKMEPILKSALELYSNHVRTCDSCSGKGFVCEICTSREVIYPFDTKTTSCPNCKALFHESCWRANPGKCPKCVRVRSIRGREKSM